MDGPAHPTWCLPTGVPAVPRVPPPHHQDPGAKPTFGDAAEGPGTGEGVRHLWGHGLPAQWCGDHHLPHRCGKWGWAVSGSLQTPPHGSHHSDYQLDLGARWPDSNPSFKGTYSCVTFGLIFFPHGSGSRALMRCSEKYQKHQKEATRAGWGYSHRLCTTPYSKSVLSHSFSNVYWAPTMCYVFY